MKLPTKQFALCLDNTGNEASLILGKVYRVVPDARGAKDDLVRVVDESGEDYLFAKDQFALVDFPQAVRRKLLALEDDRPANPSSQPASRAHRRAQTSSRGRAARR